MAARPFARPTRFSSRGESLHVATHDGSEWQWDGDEITRRLRVHSIETGLNMLPTATLDVNLAGEYATDGSEIIPALNLGDLLNFIDNGKRLCIYGEKGDERSFLFDGYPVVVKPKWVGKPGAEYLTHEVTCTSIAAQYAREKGAQIFGRYFAPAADGTVRHVEALPCVFNPEKTQLGAVVPVKNRNPTLQTIGTLTQVPVFTYDGDPAAVYWTYADVMTYLIAFYLKRPTSDGGPLYDGNGWDIAGQTTLTYNASGPQTLANPDSPTFAEILATKADRLTCENTNLLSALHLWCQSSACAMQVYTADDTGEPTTELLFSAVGDGGPFFAFENLADREIRDQPADTAPDARALMLESAGATAKNRQASDVLLKNEIEQGELLVDTANVISSCTALGAIQRYEITADSWLPGWLPDSTFGDGLSGSGMNTKIAQIKNLQLVYATDKPPAALTNETTMWARYVHEGADFAKYKTTGRLWVLNESGEFDSDYGRANGGYAVWQAAAYASAYDFHLKCEVPFGENRDTGDDDIALVARRRKMLPLLSLGPDGLEVPPVVEASWDSGTTWFPYSGAVKIMPDRCAIWLGDANLATVVPKGAAVTATYANYSVWEAIVRGVFRLRVTFCIETDQRVYEEAAQVDKAWVPLPRHTVLSVPERYRFNSRTGANSLYKTLPNYTGTDLDEGLRALTLANRYLAANEIRRFSFHAMIPWLTKDWLPGDLCKGIEDAGVDFNGLKSTGTRYPELVKVVWTNEDSGQVTHLQFDDERTDIHWLDQIKNTGKVGGGRR